MDVQCISLNNQSKLIQDYKDRRESIYTQFNYDPYQLKSYKNRYDYVTKQSYKREQLVEVLLNQNKRWGMNDKVIQNIEKLRSDDSVVVIGGQQAGLLTGPMYTINKIISIIIQAKEQSEFLKKPVIPIFWIAGEDHDFEEINHIYTYENKHLKKCRVIDKELKKYPISKREIETNVLSNWVDQIFSTFQETEHTKDLYQHINHMLERSRTYVDFFANLIVEMYKEEGLVLVDSDDPSLRELESEYFLKIIHNQELIANDVVEQLSNQAEKGYHIALDATVEDGHLFYHEQGERLLLLKREGKWITKDEQFSFTENELIEKVKTSPHLFSNNVVTRPLMQEFVFPVLSFIGGPGEIAYWSVLKQSFEALNLRMPIVMPRISLTVLQTKHEKWIEQLGLNIKTVVSKGTKVDKLNWLKRQTKLPIHELFNEVKKEIEIIHRPIQEVASSIQSDLEEMSKTNLLKIGQELDYLKKRMELELKKKNDHTLSYYDELNAHYYPNGALQERAWNVVYFMNYFGMEFPKQLLGIPPRWEQDHLIVKF